LFLASARTLQGSYHANKEPRFLGG